MKTEAILPQSDQLVFDDFRTHCDNTVGEPFMAPVTQYVFAEMLGISEHFTAGSHEWLPYSDFSTFPKQYNKQQFFVLPGSLFFSTALPRGFL